VTSADAPPEKFGRYRVLKELGRGAMGIVYLAEDTELARKVAVKMISLTGGKEERDAHEARFRQEARAAGGIGHPSIITIYDVGREGDIAFIAMELVEGRELRELIREGGLTPSQAIELAALVADGLAYAHAHGVIHRDVKPGNIMVLGDGRVKVMDFGIARLQQPTIKTQTGVLLGSPQYMSPEQISGNEVDGRADIFSLGVVLYEMLTGLKPFDATDLSQVLFWVVNMPAKAPSERRPGLPAVVDYIIARALKKKPEERYANAAEFAADLRRCLPEVRAAEAAIVMPTEFVVPGETLVSAALELARTIVRRAERRAVTYQRCRLPTSASNCGHRGISIPARPWRGCRSCRATRERTRAGAGPCRFPRPGGASTARP